MAGITEDDLESGDLAGSGTIKDGKLDVQHSLVQDKDRGESIAISVFSDAEKKYKIGETKFIAVEEGETDPITGELGLPGRVKLKSRGRVAFRLYGGEEIDVNAIDFDGILFGGDPDSLMAESPSSDAYFQGGKRARGKRAGSYIATIKDLNGDGFDDISIKAFRRDLLGVMDKGDTEIYAYAQIGEDSVLWGNTNAVFF